MSDAQRKVILNLRNGKPITLTCGGSSFMHAALYWSRLLRNRRRWSSQHGITERRAEAVKLAHEYFPELENKTAAKGLIERLGKAGVIEVTLPPYEGESQDWELRIFPWEFFLSSLTRDFRKQRHRGKPFLVTRVLPMGRSGGFASSDKVSMVKSVPSIELSKLYSFQSEIDLLKINLNQKNQDFVIENPTSAELRLKLRSEQPGLVHISGFDLNQFRSLGGNDTIIDKTLRDGYVLADSKRNGNVIEPQALAEILCAAKKKPELISFNIYNSAARLCPMAIAAGAGTAIGFQDEIDDHLAEVFYASFYDTRFGSGSLEGSLTSFRYAFEQTRALPKRLRMRGSGIVFWSDRSQLNADREDLSVVHTRKQEKRESERIERQVETDAPTEARAANLAEDLKPMQRLNYASLHNGGDLFERFVLTRVDAESPESVNIEVIVRIGRQEFPYRGTHSLGDIGMPNFLERDIRIPLAWEYLRRLTETLRTTIYIKINSDSSFLLERTYTADLAPVEEWTDDDLDRVWLPSFVLPRDPAVPRVVSGGRKYLSALLDDPNSGFDGYQGYDEFAEEPAHSVDQQVRAIWSSLLLNNKLQYFNPPPSYYATAQRVRSPSEVIDKAHGTCIDLALLLAACLEYIEIYPVLFLIKGHAFPGYWRSAAEAENFWSGLFPGGGTSSVSREEIDEETEGDTGSGSERRWVFGRKDYERIISFIAEGHLQPLESTLLTSQQGYYDACDYGVEHLNNPEEFEYLFDVRQAHTDDSGAKPLPITQDVS